MCVDRLSAAAKEFIGDPRRITSPRSRSSAKRTFKARLAAVMGLWRGRPDQKLRHSRSASSLAR
eukprot:7813098-Pyramimonas_sp.AAC.1